VTDLLERSTFRPVARGNEFHFQIDISGTRLANLRVIGTSSPLLAKCQFGNYPDDTLAGSVGLHGAGFEPELPLFRTCLHGHRCESPA